MEETIDEVDRLRDKLSRTEAERYNPDHTSVFGQVGAPFPRAPCQWPFPHGT